MKIMRGGKRLNELKVKKLTAEIAEKQNEFNKLNAERRDKK